MASFSTIILLALSDGLTFSGKHIAYDNLYKSKFGLSDGSIRVTVRRLYDRGFLQKLIKNGRSYFPLTSAGIGHLQDLFSPQAKEKWDGKWRIILAGKEVDFGKNTVGMLQRGVYISPFPVEDTISLLFFETKQVGLLSHSEVVEKIWKISKLESQFDAWMRQANSFQGSRRALANLIFQYESVIEEVPKLPQQLFPPNWPEDKARKVCIKLIEKHLRVS